ncbi:MAG: hypothetical protein GX769_00800 [Erysipelothrix sp.]|nr:hypothetical protein [Erysipelothrix sp.]
MKTNKVMSVFDGNQMQKYFLLLTKQAEEAAYQAMVESTDLDIELNDFLQEIKQMPLLKQMIQDMLLVSISNVDWNQTLKTVLDKNQRLI